MEKRVKKVFVLVHGGDISTDTWNKYANMWNSVTLSLEKAGHTVFAPALKNNDLLGHIEQICLLIKENDLKNVILVGHSYGGMIITGVADKMADKIALLVYLDAALPDSGQSLFDLFCLAGYPSKEKGQTKPYIDKLKFDLGKIKSLSKVYIFCTQSSFISVTNLIRQKIATDKSGWKCFDLPTSHVPQATMPDRLIELLLSFSD